MTQGRPRLNHERYCAQVEQQTSLLRAALDGADPAHPVATCPGWTLHDLVCHLRDNLRSVDQAVRSATDRGQTPPGLPTPAAPDSPGWWDSSLAESAASLASALLTAGPHTTARVWGLTETTASWARRGVRDLLIHRADVVLARAQTAPAQFTVDPDLAADAVEELLDLVTAPGGGLGAPLLAGLNGSGQSLLLEASGPGEGPKTAWLIEFGQDSPRWRQGRGQATATLRGPLTDLLLVLYRRLPARGGAVAVMGEPELADRWLAAVSLD